MTFTTALDRIEDRAARVHCERRGEILDPEDVIAYTSHLYPEKAEKLWGAMERKEIDPFGYMTGWVALLEEFEQSLFLERLDKQLRNLQMA